MLARLFPFLFLVSFTLQCASGPKPREEIQPTDHKVPVGLIVEREISGKILSLVLSNPIGLAVGHSGSVYLSDAGNSRVIRFDSSLTPRSDTRGYGSREGGLDRPVYICLDNRLNLIVADAGNRRLAWFDRQLYYADELLLLDEEDALKYGEIVSMATADYGELWAVDWEHGRIAVFDNARNFRTFVGDFGSPGGQLSRPEKIVANDDDGFVVCDAGNSRLVFYDSYGNYLDEQIDELIDYPVAMTFSPEGMWVLGGHSGRVIFTGRDQVGRFVTGPVLAGNKLPLKDPTDILVLPDGRLLIADSGNNRLLVCRPYFE